MDFLSILIILALVATVIALMLGVLSMSAGRSLGAKVSEPLMWARVGLQGLAVVLLLLAIWMR